jgi:glycosyltransferase involved in cell wall biosynthesis
MTWGGAEKMLNRLAVGFVEAGLAVDLVVAAAEGPNLSGLPACVRVVDLGSKRLLSSVLPLARYLRRERPKALLSTLDHANLVAIWARMLGRSRARLVLREANTLSVASLGSEDFRDRIVPRLARCFYRRADAIVAVSEGVARDLIDNVRLPERMVHVVHNPTYDPSIVELMEEPVDHPWFADRGSPVVIAVGRLSPQKRLDDLLRAVAVARREQPLRLMVIGDGEERGRLESLTAELGLTEDVSFAGYQLNPYAYLARADLYALSSAWEGFPNTLVEALACGLAVVATDCPSGPREILGVEALGVGPYGTLVPVGAPDSFGEALVAELSRRRNREDQQKRARCFSIEQALGRYMEILEVSKGA